MPSKIHHYGEMNWLTYEETCQKIDQLSEGFSRLNLGKDGKIGLFLNTSLEWMESLNACFNIALPVVTFFPAVSQKMLVGGIQAMHINTIIADEDLLSTLVNSLDELPSLERIIFVRRTSTYRVPVSPIPILKFEDLFLENESELR